MKEHPFFAGHFRQRCNILYGAGFVVGVHYRYESGLLADQFRQGVRRREAVFIDRE